MGVFSDSHTWTSSIGENMERNLEEITVEVIQKCNSNCVFCSSMSTQKCENEIPINKLKDISSFAKSKQTKTINISGGEPLLKIDLLDFVKYNHEISGLSNIIYISFFHLLYLYIQKKIFLYLIEKHIKIV